MSVLGKKSYIRNILEYFRDEFGDVDPIKEVIGSKPDNKYLEKLSLVISDEFNINRETWWEDNSLRAFWANAILDEKTVVQGIVITVYWGDNLTIISPNATGDDLTVYDIVYLGEEKGFAFREVYESLSIDELKLEILEVSQQGSSGGGNNFPNGITFGTGDEGAGIYNDGGDLTFYDAGTGTEARLSDIVDIKQGLLPMYFHSLVFSSEENGSVYTSVVLPFSEPFTSLTGKSYFNQVFNRSCGTIGGDPNLWAEFYNCNGYTGFYHNVSLLLYKQGTAEKIGISMYDPEEQDVGGAVFNFSELTDTVTEII